MTLCREWTLVKSDGVCHYAKPLLCRSWGCDYCRPNRKNQLLARAASGEPNRFITLTINPRTGDSPEHRARILAHAWNVIVKRLRRSHSYDDIAYLAVVEETKNGEPHLHILFRGPYVQQSVLSDAMNELAESPIVDIRLIRKRREVVSYVAKYITKSPAQFGNAKRYWSSKNYELSDGEWVSNVPHPEFPWRIDRNPLAFMLNLWHHDGLLSRQLSGPIVVAFPPGRGPPL